MSVDLVFNELGTHKPTEIQTLCLGLSFKTNSLAFIIKPKPPELFKTRFQSEMQSAFSFSFENRYPLRSACSAHCRVLEHV
ncbi:UNVERIFIED_CONTAM: hypothetical protein FKN15_041669 [Acipenser sinensis]